MSVPPGWFPDPGGSGRLRYWDGHQWTQHLADPSQAVPPVGSVSPGSPAQSRSDQDPGRSSRSPMLWIVVGIVLVVAMVVGLVVVLRPPGGGAAPIIQGESVAPASPSVTGWDERETPPPSPTPSASTETATVPVPCDTTPSEPLTSTGSTVTAGGFTFPHPAAWNVESFRWSQNLVQTVTLGKRVEDATWWHSIEAGYAPGFTDEKTAAETILNCYFTSGSDHGHESYEVLFSEEISINGEVGWWLKVRETNPDVPGTYAILHAVVVDAGDPQGMRAFWTVAYEIDQQAVDDAEDVVANLALAD